MSRVVVLGSSFGGITAAYGLRKHLPPEHEVLLVSNSSVFVFRPALTWVALGVKEPYQITVDAARALKRRGIPFLHATVERIDPRAQVVRTTGGEVPYDYLVVALGAHLEREAVPGLDEHTECILWLDDALRARERLASFIGGDIVLLEVQGSAVPCAVYELAFGLHDWLQKSGLRRKTRIHLVTHQRMPFGIGGPKAAGYVERQLRQAGVRLYLGETVQRVGEREVELASGELVHGDLIFAAPPYRGTDALLRSDDLVDRHGFVRVDRTMRSLGFANVYAVGDSVAFRGPKSGRMAELQAHVAAHNLSSHILGKGGARPYKSHLMCIMELGSGKGLFTYRKHSPGQGPATVVLSYSGRAPHWVKGAFERYYLATRF